MTNQETAQYLLAKALIQGGYLSQSDRDEARRVLGWDSMSKAELSRETWSLLQTIDSEGRRLDVIAA